MSIFVNAEINMLRLVAIAIFASACTATASAPIQSVTCADLTKSFFRKPARDQVAEFATLDLDKQYAVFICGNQVVHPPALHLAEPFSRGGKRTADFLKQKVAETQDDLTINDIVFVFGEMSGRKTFDVAGDAELMRLLTDKVDRMKDQNWKRIAKQTLTKIASPAR